MSEIKKFRKLPVEIEAVQLTAENAFDVRKWIGDAWHSSTEHPPEKRDIRIWTREGVMHAAQGDWIIRGIKGEFYPCKPDIFEQTYEAVSS